LFNAPEGKRSKPEVVWPGSKFLCTRADNVVDCSGNTFKVFENLKVWATRLLLAIIIYANWKTAILLKIWECLNANTTSEY